MEKCENCKYWNNEMMDEDIFGECKRFPPVMSDSLYTQQMKSNPDSDDESRWVATMFPVVADNESCGEWKAKES